MYLVSVYFDDKSNKIISDYINKIAQKTGNTFMTDNHVPPHLTIMSVEAREEDKLTEVMGKLERYLTKGQIQLVSVGVLLQGQQRLCENQVCDPDHRGGEPSRSTGAICPH